MREDDQHKAEPASDGRYGEEVEGDERADVILEKRAPGLGGWPTSSRHEPRHGPLGDREPELHELAVDPGRAPQRVGVGHLADEASELAVHAPGGRRADATAGSSTRRNRADASQ